MTSPDEPTARDALRAWIAAGPRDPSAASAARAALRALEPGRAGGMIVQLLAARAHRRDGARDPIPTHVVEALLADGRPELMLALGYLAHWPRFRFSNPRYPAAFVADDPAGWRGLILRRIGGALGTSFRLVGATARGDGSDAAYLRAALLERAMNLEIAWPHDAWAAHIAPHAGHPIFWLVHSPDGRTTVRHADSEFPLAHPPAPPGVRVLHPAVLTPEQRAELATRVHPDAEPFAQIHREVHAPTADEQRERMVRRYRDRPIDEAILFGHLRRRGWRRGEILDFPRFFEMHHSDPEAAWRPYVRLAPGIAAEGPASGGERPNLQRIHAISFQPIAEPGPLWGGYIRTTDHDGVQAFADDHRPTRWQSAARVYGERLADVSPVAFSEAVRTIDELFARQPQ